MCLLFLLFDKLVSALCIQTKEFFPKKNWYCELFLVVGCPLSKRTLLPCFTDSPSTSFFFYVLLMIFTYEYSLCCIRSFVWPIFFKDTKGTTFPLFIAGQWKIEILCFSFISRLYCSMVYHVSWGWCMCIRLYSQMCVPLCEMCQDFCYNIFHPKFLCRQSLIEVNLKWQLLEFPWTSFDISLFYCDLCSVFMSGELCCWGRLLGLFFVSDAAFFKRTVGIIAWSCFAMVEWVTINSTTKSKPNQISTKYAFLPWLRITKKINFANFFIKQIYSFTTHSPLQKPSKNNFQVLSDIKFPRNIKVSKKNMSQILR